MKKTYLPFALLALILLVACGSGSEVADLDAEQATGGELTAEADNKQVVAAATRLADGYEDALSITGQLAVGTMQLEETELAVNEAQAADLLPLWQALQSLTASDTTAAAELEAVARQIEETMTSEQIQAIVAMALTNSDVTDLLESGALSIGGFGGRGGGAQQEALQGSNGVVPPGAMPGGFPGGGPGGGLGRGQGGGFGAGQGGALDEDARATRQAQFAAGEGGMQDISFINAAIRLLQTKTGQVPADGRVAMFSELYRIISEATGLTAEEIQTKASEGQTLSAVIEASGRDVTTIREAAINALEALPDMPDQEIEQFVDFWLGIQEP